MQDQKYYKNDLLLKFSSDISDENITQNKTNYLIIICGKHEFQNFVKIYSVTRQITLF